MRLVLNTYATPISHSVPSRWLPNAQKPRTETEEKACSSERAKKGVR
jgi:hypothetical protein